MTAFTRRQALAGLTLAPLSLSPVAMQAAHASTDWPARPIRMVIPAAPGGGTDVLGRLLSDALSKSLKQSVFIDNRAGANGLLASEYTARAPADGYTVLFSYAGAIAINPSLFARTPDPIKALTPIAQVGAMGNVLLCTPDLPVHNLTELVAYAKANSMNYGSWGVGSGAQLTMEDFLARAKLQMTHAPYKGVAAIVNDMLSGVLKLGWADVASSTAFVTSGKLRALAVSGPVRMPQYPQVATMREQGFAFDTTSWYGLFAPAKLDPAIVQRLNSEVTKAVSSPAFRERLASLNMPDSPTPDVATFTQTVRNDMATWGTIARRLGIKPE